MAVSLLALGFFGRAGIAQAQNYAPAQTTWQRGAFPASSGSAVQPKTVIVTPITAPAASALQPPTSIVPQPPQETVVSVQAYQDVNMPIPAAEPVQQLIPVPPPIVQVVAQVDKAPRYSSETPEFRSLREPPGLEVLMRLETEAQWKERMVQEARKTGERLVFPDEPVLSKEPYPGRHWTPMIKQVEPSYVVHGRLYFEQPNIERGLWDFGVFAPVLSVGKFYWDIATLPYHWGTRPGQHYDTSAGKCLPGDPIPFYLYPPELSLTGVAAQAAAVTGAFFIFP